jgi:hypothetical protein
MSTAGDWLDLNWREFREHRVRLGYPPVPIYVVLEYSERSREGLGRGAGA